MEELDVSFARVYISPGECVLWRGCPEKGNLLTPHDIFMIPFSIFWCGFAVFWTVTASITGGSFGFFGLPFVAVGLYLVFGRFIWTAIQRSRTVYVITNQKIIRRRMGNIDMINLNTNLPMRLKIYKNGNGTITIGSSGSWDYGDSWNRNRGVSWSTPSPFMLENIPDPERVYRILTQK